MNEYGFPILAYFILPFGPVITLWVENMSLHKTETKNVLNKLLSLDNKISNVWFSLEYLILPIGADYFRDAVCIALRLVEDCAQSKY